VAGETEAAKTVEARLEVTPFCTVALPESWSAALAQGKISIPDSVRLYALAVAADGSRVLGKLYSDTGSGVVSVDRQGAITQIGATGDWRQHRLIAGAFDGRWVVWSEGHSAEDSNDWDILAGDSRSGAAFVIATAPRVNGAPVSGPYIIPVVSQGKAAWVQANQSGQFEVHLYDLAAREDRVLSAGNALPPIVFWGSRLLWGERFTENGQEAGQLVMIDATTGKHLEVPEPLASIRQLGSQSLGASGDLVAWSEDPHSVTVWRTGAKKAQQIFVDRNGQVDWIAVAGDLVAWRGLKAPMVADLRSHSIAPLTEENGSVVTNGKALLLSKIVGPRVHSDDPLTRNVEETDVVDVTKLPPLPKCPS
jgi:hypothetical protein